MKRLGYIVPVALLLFGATTALVAQETGGCVDSPENPTAVLALIGAAGFGISQLWSRYRARK
jgi:XrtJ-associated TM-motif-TM protein